MQPDEEIPVPNSMSNSACRNGAATFFFTTFSRSVVLDRLHEVLIDAEDLVDLRLDLLGDFQVLVQVRLRVVAALAEPLVAVGEERAGLRDDRVLDPEVQDAARRGDPGAELDVELRLPERRGDLFLHDVLAVGRSRSAPRGPD